MTQVTNVQSRSSAEAHTLRQRENAQVQVNGARRHTFEQCTAGLYCATLLCCGVHNMHTAHVGNSEES